MTHIVDFIYLSVPFQSQRHISRHFAINEYNWSHENYPNNDSEKKSLQKSDLNAKVYLPSNIKIKVQGFKNNQKLKGVIASLIQVLSVLQNEICSFYKIFLIFVSSMPMPNLYTYIS